MGTNIKWSFSVEWTVFDPRMKCSCGWVERGEQAQGDVKGTEAQAQIDTAGPWL